MHKKFEARNGVVGRFVRGSHSHPATPLVSLEFFYYYLLFFSDFSVSFVLLLFVFFFLCCSCFGFCFFPQSEFEQSDPSKKTNKKHLKTFQTTTKSLQQKPPNSTKQPPKTLFFFNKTTKHHQTNLNKTLKSLQTKNNKNPVSKLLGTAHC